MTGADITRPPVHRITLFQLGVLLPACLLLLAVDRVRAYSVLSGGLTAVVPQAYFAFRVFKWSGARHAETVLRAGYSGETSKYLLSAVAFAAVFALLRPIDAPAVFAGYVAMLLIQIIGSWRMLTHRRRP